MKRILTLAAAAAALACGSTSSNNAATSRNNPGAGSSTLLVQGDINASTTAGAPLTIFSVTVRDGAGNTVGGATVTVLNASLPNGSIALVQATPPTGAYANAVASFPTGDFRLDVVKGTDSVQGVVVDGPGSRQAGDRVHARHVVQRSRPGRLHHRRRAEPPSRQPAGQGGSLQRGGGRGRSGGLAPECDVQSLDRSLHRPVVLLRAGPRLPGPPGGHPAGRPRAGRAPGRARGAASRRGK